MYFKFKNMEAVNIVIKVKNDLVPNSDVDVSVDQHFLLRPNQQKLK